MRTLQRFCKLLSLPALLTLLAACAPAPIYPAHGGAFVSATPEQVATAPANFHGLRVVWGGRVIRVHNLARDSEVEILAYPLDSSQRPRVRQPATGRFIAIVPGFVEPMEYPAGALVTLRGTIAGSRAGDVGQAAYTFPTVDSRAMHRWTAGEMRQGHPNVNVGIGIGGWIH